MLKDEKVNPSSSDKATTCHDSFGDEREWDETECPICMEHPHNAMLLLCSSREKGCRPFMCDTSYRHSNCLDQFTKSSELVCPLCRGTVTGWVAVKDARNFMNSKARSCSLETCDFVGSYSELRKHARVQHPYRRPAVVSPTRQSDWIEQEQERNLDDANLFLSGSSLEYEISDHELWSHDTFNDHNYFRSFNSIFSPFTASGRNFIEVPFTRMDIWAAIQREQRTTQAREDEDRRRTSYERERATHQRRENWSNSRMSYTRRNSREWVMRHTGLQLHHCVREPRTHPY